MIILIKSLKILNFYQNNLNQSSTLKLKVFSNGEKFQLQKRGLFMASKNLADLEKIKEECKAIVTKRATTSGVTAVVPVPGVDVAADIGMLLELIPAINHKFGLTPEQINQLDPKSKTIMHQIIKKTGNDLVGKVVTKYALKHVVKKVGTRVAVKSVTKFIPIIGQATSAAISFGAMKIVGNSHVDECYSIAKEFLKQQFRVS